MSRITLKDILENKRREVERNKADFPLRLLRKKIAWAGSLRNFKEAIHKKKLMAIAEIKMRSPSAGIITNLDAASIAAEYEKSRYCCAISVLTDEKYFGGDIKLLSKVRSQTTKPILRKDFIIDEYQIYEARAYRADMLLLIAAILSRKKLKKFFEIAGDIGLPCLIESHSIEDLKKIPDEAEIYGINTRDLAHDFSTNLDVSKKLIGHIPAGKIIIVESGIETKRDIEFIKSLKRVDAVLIGTSILKTPHPGKTLDIIFS